LPDILEVVLMRGLTPNGCAKNRFKMLEYRGKMPLPRY
jgi:hypothetical protein